MLGLCMQHTLDIRWRRDPRHGRQRCYSTVNLCYCGCVSIDQGYDMGLIGLASWICLMVYSSSQDRTQHRWMTIFKHKHCTNLGIASVIVYTSQPSNTFWGALRRQQSLLPGSDVALKNRARLIVNTKRDDGSSINRQSLYLSKNISDKRNDG